MPTRSSAPIESDAKGQEATLLFDGSFTLDRSRLAGQLDPAVHDMSVDESKSGVFVRLSLGKGYEARGFREDEAFVVDIAGPPAAQKDAAAPPPAPAPPEDPEAYFPSRYRKQTSRQSGLTNLFGLNK